MNDPTLSCPTLNILVYDMMCRDEMCFELSRLWNFLRFVFLSLFSITRKEMCWRE